VHFFLGGTVMDVWVSVYMTTMLMQVNMEFAATKEFE